MKEYSDDLIEEIKENIDIVDFIGEYVDLTRQGKEYLGNAHYTMKELVRSVLHQVKICITALVAKRVEM